MKRSYKRIIGSRLIVTALAVLIQLTWLWGLLEFLAPYALPINIILTSMWHPSATNRPIRSCG